MATNNEKLQELSVEEKLQHLYELQRIDTEIDKIKTLRGELPLEVQDLEDEIAGLETRLENLKNAFSVQEKKVPCKRIILVDDIYTTGSTMDEATRVLKENGAEFIYFLCISVGRGS